MCRAVSWLLPVAVLGFAPQIRAESKSEDAMDDAIAALVKSRVADRNAVTSTEWKAVAGGAELVVSGTAQTGATRVLVRLGDEGVEREAVPSPDGAWSVIFPASDVAGLENGPVVARTVVKAPAGDVALGLTTIARPPSSPARKG